MKTILLLLLSVSLNAQCNTTMTARPYLSIPSFLSLYFGNQCISQTIGDTTICVKVARQGVGQVAAFSYSSPNGLPAYVTSVKQYNQACELIENSPMVYPGDDTVVVCYTIQANFIDNFCPYTILAGGLAVDFCGIYAYHSDGELRLRWITCSNIGTEKFEVLHSTDAQSWRVIATQKPEYSTNSKTSNYNLRLPFNHSGINYFVVREKDYNGNFNASEIVFVDVPPMPVPSSGIDILGRQVSNAQYMFYIGK